MKKKRLLRLSKRVLILLLCTALVSGSCFNKYKITAHATSVVATVGAYTLYEICLYVGSIVVTGLGIGYAYENRDELANIGKDFIDWLNIDEISGWVLSKADITGNSYVYGTEALQEVKDTSWNVIQGGGNSPENNEDNDGDGDKDFDDRTEELKNFGMWATTAFANFICEQIQPLLNAVQAGEEIFINDILGNPDYAFNGTFLPDEFGNYNYHGYRYISSDYSRIGVYDGTISNNICGVYYFDASGDAHISFHYLKNEMLYAQSLSGYIYDNSDTDAWEQDGTLSTKSFFVEDLPYSFNFPVFSSEEAALNYLMYGTLDDCINYAKVFQIADWLQENWTSAIEALNTGIRSLYDNALIVGEAANQALLNQSNGLGYIEDLLNRIANALPLALPGTVADPAYYPDDSSTPALDPDDLPWNQPEIDSGTDDDVDVDPEPEPEPDVDIDISGYVVDLRTLFPFCIPFDFIALLETLNAEPVAPKFEIPFVVPSLGIEETYVIDLSIFDEQMAVIRKFELVGFIIGLMFLTSKMIKW